MISKFLLSLVLLACVGALGGFAVLAVWDVPVQPMQVEKTLDSASLLQKG